MPALALVVREAGEDVSETEVEVSEGRIGVVDCVAVGKAPAVQSTSIFFANEDAYPVGNVSKSVICHATDTGGESASPGASVVLLTIKSVKEPESDNAVQPWPVQNVFVKVVPSLIDV